jgi:hypothetical protein
MLQYSLTFAAFMIFPCAEERNFLLLTTTAFCTFQIEPTREKMPKRQALSGSACNGRGEGELCVTVRAFARCFSISASRKNEQVIRKVCGKTMQI